MARAIAPDSVPPLPKGAAGWRRSLRRGSVFHAHLLGFTACNSIYLDRHNSEEPANLAAMQYWGVCPRCYAKGQKDSQS